MEESAACVFSWSRQQELSLFEWFSGVRGAWCDGGRVATRRLEAGTVEAYGPDLQLLRKRVDGCGEADLGEKKRSRKDNRVGYNEHNSLSPAAIEGLL
jgi:hypothetical protein